MGEIKVMPASLANQIAAGEVVERPASCIKELVENSLDAGAHKVAVTIVEGGIAYMSVEDDGAGMDQADAVLAFARHATSKIRSHRDLARIQTLGFRGEALASIAAVARVTVQTRRRAEEYGWQVEVNGSDTPTPPEVVGRAPGTLVEVRDLFFNTPARLKYLRSVHTEQAHCINVVQQAALSRPDVAFSCQVGEKMLFQTPGRGNVLDVLAVLYGVGETRQFLRVEASTPDYTICGYVGRPTQGRSSRNHGHWFINGRPIRNYAMHQAVVDGYQGRLMIQRQPVYALFLSLDATLVDVNIHPHKSEVRFSEERDVTRLVRSAVTQALEETFLVPDVSSDRHGHRNLDAASPAVVDGRDKSQMQQRTLWQEGTGPTRNHQGTSGGSESFQDKSRTQISYPAGSVARNDGHSNKYIPEPSPSSHNVEAWTQAYAPERPKDPLPQVQEQKPGQQAGRELLKDLRPIGQTLATYILAEAGDTLFVIDQHAAHERILYERFWSQTEEGKVRQLPLLTPLTLSFTPAQLSVVLHYAGILESLGIELEEFGGQEVIIRTIPHVWEGQDPEVLLEDLLGLLEGSHPANVREAVREQVVMRACKAAIKANHRLSDMEIQALCQSLSEASDPFHCPHGRPVLIKLTNRDLEKEFRRIV